MLETAELIRRWRELLAAEKGAQTEQVSRGGRGITGGNSEVARRLNLDRNKVRRFAHISGLSDDAKQFAISHNMDDIGTPLEDAARAGGAAEQVAVLARHVAQREVQRRDRQLRQPVSPAEVDRRFRRTMNETATEFAGLFRDLRPWTGGPTTQDELATARQHLEQWLAVYREILPPPCRSLIEQALLHMT